MNLDVKNFLEDTTLFFTKIGSNVYSKVPYNQNLMLLYMGDDFKFKGTDMEFIGVYSLYQKKFLVMSNHHFCRKIDEEYESFSINNLNEDLDKRVQNELLVILKQLVTSSTTLSSETLDRAKKMKMRNEIPEYSFHGYENAEITLENIEEFFADKDEYAYTIAEQIIQNKNECISSYQEYVNIQKALTQFSQKLPIDMEIEIALETIKQDSRYKNLKIHTISSKGLIEENISTEQLNNYPPYAFTRIYWGKKLLFDINDYDANEIDALRTNAEYNIKILNGVVPFCVNNIFDYIDARMYSNYDFVMFICKKYEDQYNRIDESFRRNISFIKICGVHNYNLFQYTPEDVIMDNKSYFLNLFEENTDYYSYFPEKIKNDMDFICTFIHKNGKNAITELSESLFQYDKVQEAFDEWYLENPVYLENSYPTKVSLLRNEDTKIHALNYSSFETLTEEDKDDEKFIMGFLKRVEITNSRICESSFIKVYSNLSKLKTSNVIVDKLIKLSAMTEQCWKILDDSMKTKDRQRIIVQNNPKLLCLMDDEIQLEFVYENPKEYLPLMNQIKARSGYGRRIIYTKQKESYEELILDLMKVKGDDIDFLKCVDYEQLSDEKFGWKMMKINKKAYCYLDTDLKNNKKFALEATKEFSVIPYLHKTKWHKSLFDDREVMEASLKQCPSDFSDIPQASRQSGDAPLLSCKDFILYAIRLDSNNACYIDPKTGFLEDEDVCFEAVTDDIDTIRAFSGKLFRNETFVYRLCEGIEKQISLIQSDKIKQIWYTEIKENLMHVIPKKIKGTSTFKTKFPKFCEE